MIEARIAGIPCQIQVDTCLVVKPWKGSALTCPSSDDYYGYSEVEFSVFDRRGHKAAWLEKKMTPKDEASIRELILTQEEEY